MTEPNVETTRVFDRDGTDMAAPTHGRIFVDTYIQAVDETVRALAKLRDLTANAAAKFPQMAPDFLQEAGSWDQLHETVHTVQNTIARDQFQLVKELDENV